MVMSLEKIEMIIFNANRLIRDRTEISKYIIILNITRKMQCDVSALLVFHVVNFKYQKNKIGCKISSIIPLFHYYKVNF